jgi:membrane-bound lytic murein transglycosylase B
MKKSILLLALLGLTLVNINQVFAKPADDIKGPAKKLPTPNNHTFDNFLKKLRQEALRRGISANTVSKYLSQIKAPKKRPVVLLHHQAQHVLTFAEYSKRLVTRERINDGAYYLKKYQTLLEKIQQKYHVQPRFIIALWGLETDYGKNVGESQLIPSLVTLAYQHHRSDFYTNELMFALQMLDRKKVIPQQLISTWDGGMGQPSFEPSNYFAYGVDFNNDGFVNIWTNIPDSLASIANFLHKLHWDGKHTWGTEVTLTHKIPANKVGLDKYYSIDHWRKWGVHLKQNLAGSLPASLLTPNGQKGPAYLVLHNFQVLMHWNNTTFEGLCVGLLSNKIVAVKRVQEPRI